MKNNTLYILTGLPYSGKTTLRNELIKRFGFSAVSVDEEINKKGFHVESMDQEDWDEVYSMAYEGLKAQLSDGKSIVLDVGNLKKSERDTARRIADSTDTEYKLIYVKTEIGKIMQRRSRNLETQERGHLEDAVMERALEMSEEPSQEENPIIYNSKMDLENWIKENIASL